MALGQEAGRYKIAEAATTQGAALFWKLLLRMYLRWCEDYFTSHVVAGSKKFAQVARPRLAMTSLICWFITSS